MNRSLNLCSKIGYFGVAGVKLHTDAHSYRMNQMTIIDTLEMKYQKSKFWKISEPDQMSVLIRVKAPCYQRNEETLKNDTIIMKYAFIHP